VAVCRRCLYTIVPTEIACHLRTHGQRLYSGSRSHTTHYKAVPRPLSRRLLMQSSTGSPLPIACQTFYIRCASMRYFPVTLSTVSSNWCFRSPSKGCNSKRPFQRHRAAAARHASIPMARPDAVASLPLGLRHHAGRRTANYTYGKLPELQFLTIRLHCQTDALGCVIRPVRESLLGNGLFE
jgi:hypothetical protein